MSKDTIYRQAAVDALGGNVIVTSRESAQAVMDYIRECADRIRSLPSAQPERKKDIIQTFHDYQIEWLTNHYDLALEPQLEELIVRFLHDTANMYMLEMERRTDETD